MSTDATAELARLRRRRWLIFGYLLVAAVLLAVGVGLLLIFGREPASGKGDLVGAGVQIPSPDRSLVPTINFSQAQPWPAGTRPIAPDGFRVTAYASGLDHPRWLYALPNADVLVAEASTMPRHERPLRLTVQNWPQRNAGSVKDSANRITARRG